MTIGEPYRAIPLELRLDRAKRRDTHGFAGIMLTSTSMLKWSWWHIRSYVPIVCLLLLALGSLIVLQCHWLYRRFAHVSMREKEALKNMG
ncbi:MAG: hypothetical protein KME42_19430 [Tildeniella nuda ZEHNDER 1965/U140]|jgi:hypothetical protein|nr:hypothetical protein [Tildeniella nuda ZEHNDER 1965/U140]